MSERTYLEEISIRNLGIIDQSTLELGSGLNVLTGETGAGKTMILTALALVLGGKSDSSLVRTGTERLVASAQFSLPEVAPDLQEIVDSSGSDISDGSLILTRTVNSDGKSKAVAGGTTVPAATLASFADQLVEIHGQAANHQIVKAARQRELLDRYAGAKFSKELSSYQEVFSCYNELKARIESAVDSASKKDREILELEEFLLGWQKLKAVRGEYAETTNQIARLSSVEDLRAASAGATEALSDETSGALTTLGAARRFLDIAKGKDSKLDEIAGSIAEGFFLIDDAARELTSYLTALEADPGKLDVLQSRKAAINAFLKKYGSSIDPDEDLILLAARAKGAKEAIADLNGGEDRIKELQNELAGIKSELVKSAKKLTDLRNEAALALSKEVTTEISALAMPHTVFSIAITSANYTGALKESDFTNLGCDEIAMQIQGHAGAPLIALGKGASGGEMSRIMLALEVVLAQTHPVGTYIFDEVDAGVGGKAAIEVGRRLAALAKHTQVIVVTHLPQVAAWADTHFVVKKSSDGSVSQSDVTKLEDKARVAEIARMLAGLEGSASAQEHAAELLAMRESISK
ncbi:MAG: DNA repair protein RecN [Actinobacteria bacterium]|nr:DNA repair protein RecN [Actinomycetota bacterium]